MELNITLVLQLAMFFGLFVWLSNVILYPLLDLFEERENRIEGAAKLATELRASADESAGVIDEKLGEARMEARKILAGLREEGLQTESHLIDSARTAATEKIEDARSQLAQSGTSVRQTLESRADELAEEIVQKILGRTI
jgi:F-type H+-transporting ATPase subunit b